MKSFKRCAPSFQTNKIHLQRLCDNFNQSYYLRFVFVHIALASYCILYWLAAACFIAHPRMQMEIKIITCFLCLDLNALQASSFQLINRNRVSQLQIMCVCVWLVFFFLLSFGQNQIENCVKHIIRKVCKQLSKAPSTVCAMSQMQFLLISFHIIFQFVFNIRSVEQDSIARIWSCDGMATMATEIAMLLI